jgi:HTH-type transcriptional regulator/antitoxin HigA
MSKVYLEYKDEVAFHPGYYLEELIEDTMITQEEFAVRVGTSPKTISKLINGLTGITTKLAHGISTVTGTSIELWTNLQSKYDNTLIKIEDMKSIDEECKLLDVIPYKYFTENGYLPKENKRVSKVLNLRKFLKVASLKVFQTPNMLANFRMSNQKMNDKNILNSNIWLQTALNVADEIDVEPYNEKKLEKNIEVIRRMTIQKPNVFFDNLNSLLNECGVAFVILPHLSNSGINGVTKWINKDKVLVALNDRSYKADTFWFSLFHELKHVQQRKLKKVLINSKIKTNDYPEYEKKADEFARETLIPKVEFDEFINNGNFDSNSVRVFAKKQNIHPGIVVGRLQYEEFISYSHLNMLKNRYKIINEKK